MFLDSILFGATKMWGSIVVPKGYWMIFREITIEIIKDTSQVEDFQDWSKIFRKPRIVLRKSVQQEL